MDHSCFAECTGLSLACRSLWWFTWHILPLTHGVFSWFQFGGNTFVVQDNTNADGFANTADVVVALTGLVDLTTATLGNAVITLG